MLGLVFRYYAGGETFEHPLETLLLICRAWNNAALGHRSLWSRFKLRLANAESLRNTRPPTRLAWCVPDSLLDITISIYPGDPHSPMDDGESGDEGTIRHRTAC
jgi:hypothetical protein